MFNSFPLLELSPNSLNEFIGFCATRVSLSTCSSFLPSELSFPLPYVSVLQIQNSKFIPLCALGGSEQSLSCSCKATQRWASCSSPLILSSTPGGVFSESHPKGGRKLYAQDTLHNIVMAQKSKESKCLVIAD